MFEYQKYNTYFAQTAGQMEELCKEELAWLGAKEVKTAYRGVYFTAEFDTVLQIVYQTTLATRIFAPLLTFDCHSDRYLKNTTRKKIKWDLLLSVDNTFAISATVANSKIKHSKYAALCLKDSIADYFREKTGSRPDVDTKNPDLEFNLRVENNKAVVSFNLSGGSLHRRGYRTVSMHAPMQETLAAAILRISGWNGEKPLWDLMCGSGTILGEALMRYCNIPAAYLRDEFSFRFLPEFDKTRWINIKNEIDSKIRPLSDNLIFGSDISKEAIVITKTNLKKLPYSHKVNICVKPFQKADLFENGVIVTNPPYGIRMGDKKEIQRLYKELGDFLKQNCKGSVAYVYIGDKQLKKAIGLKPSKRVPLVNGKLDGELLEIEIY